MNALFNSDNIVPTDKYFESSCLHHAKSVNLETLNKEDQELEMDMEKNGYVGLFSLSVVQCYIKRPSTAYLKHQRNASQDYLQEKKACVSVSLIKLQVADV